MEDRWLSVDEIAAYLGIKRDTVYRWISGRNMPGHKIGRLWKFNKQEVDEWVKSSGADDKKVGQQKMTVLLYNKGQGKVGDALAEGIQVNAHISIWGT